MCTFVQGKKQFNLLSDRITPVLQKFRRPKVLTVGYVTFDHALTDIQSTWVVARDLVRQPYVIGGWDNENGTCGGPHGCQLFGLSLKIGPEMSQPTQTPIVGTLQGKNVVKLECCQSNVCLRGI